MNAGPKVGRFNASYQRIHTASGIYIYRNTGEGWRTFAIMANPGEQSVFSESFGPVSSWVRAMPKKWAQQNKRASSFEASTKSKA